LTQFFPFEPVKGEDHPRARLSPASRFAKSRLSENPAAPLELLLALMEDRDLAVLLCAWGYPRARAPAPRVRRARVDDA